MTEDVDSIKSTLKEFILKQLLPGEDPEALADDTPLMTSGVMDSIATIQFAAFVDEQWGVELQAHEMSPDYIDTLSAMAEIVHSKLQA